MTRPSDRERGGPGGGDEGGGDINCYRPLSSVITRCTLSSPVVTHCHPFPLVDTRYYPLSPAVTRALGESLLGLSLLFASLSGSGEHTW